MEVSLLTLYIGLIKASNGLWMASTPPWRTLGCASTSVVPHNYYIHKKVVILLLDVCIVWVILRLSITWMTS